MIISFDLDDTLIPGIKRFTTRPKTLLHRILGLETLRIGAIELLKKLQADGHKIYVYTTSFRSTTKILWTFFVHGIHLDKIINQTVHNKMLAEQTGNYSKYPPIFNIDLHVDDSQGVALEGERYNFKTIIVAETDSDWDDLILAEISFLSLG